MRIFPLCGYTRRKNNSRLECLAAHLQDTEMAQPQRKPSTYAQLYQALADSDHARRQQRIDELREIQGQLRALRRQHRLRGLSPQDLRLCNRLANTERLLMMTINATDA